MTDQLPADERRRDDGPDPTGDMSGAGSTTPASSRGRFGRMPRDQRISRWDRPPRPHDWRFYVGTIGKVLIVTGLMIFGFVAYQLWGTGIETAIAQNRLEDRFDTIVADVAVDDDATPSATEASSPDATDAPTVGTPATETTPTTPPSTDAADTTRDDVTTTAPVAVDPTDVTVEPDPVPQPSRGEPLLRLEIPAIGRDDIVVPGVTLDDLQNGPGHYPDTPLPGQLGNAAIAGHRTTYGAPFFDVDQLEPGDEIITTRLDGERFVYEVTSIEIVSASDYWVVTTRNPDIAELTLTSCHPKYTARDRIIVHSVLNPEKSSEVGPPTFYTLDGDQGAPIDVDDPVLTGEIEIARPDSALADPDESAGPSTTSATIASTTGSSTASTTATTSEPNTATTTPTTTATTSEPTSETTVAARSDTAADDEPRAVTDDELAAARAAGADPSDAFSQGWFDDRGAFVQIALWGLALVLVSVLGRRLSRRYRRDSVGILVGVVPFVVALYFFYQNVNRLLPPGI